MKEISMASARNLRLAQPCTASPTPPEWAQMEYLDREHRIFLPTCCPPSPRRTKLAATATRAAQRDRAAEALVLLALRLGDDRAVARRAAQQPGLRELVDSRALRASTLGAPHQAVAGGAPLEAHARQPPWRRLLAAQPQFRRRQRHLRQHCALRVGQEHSSAASASATRAATRNVEANTDYARAEAALGTLLRMPVIIYAKRCRSSGHWGRFVDLFGYVGYVGYNPFQ